MSKNSGKYFGRKSMHRSSAIHTNMAGVPKLVEGVDYYMAEDGTMTLTREFLLKRGYCCNHGCQECPWRNSVPCRIDILHEKS